MTPEPWEEEFLKEFVPGGRKMDEYGNKAYLQAAAPSIISFFKEKIHEARETEGLKTHYRKQIEEEAYQRGLEQGRLDEAGLCHKHAGKDYERGLEDMRNMAIVKMEEYFDGLIFVSDPTVTRKNIIAELQSLPVSKPV